MWSDLSSVLSQFTRLTDRRTNRRMDRITIARRRLHSMQRGQKSIGFIDCGHDIRRPGAVNWLPSSLKECSRLFVAVAQCLTLSARRIFSRGGQIKWSVRRKSPSGVQGRAPVRVWGAVLNIMHKYFVYTETFDNIKFLLVTNARKILQHFQMGQIPLAQPCGRPHKKNKR